MRTVFVGDVHGCLDELRTLIAALDLRADDRLVFLGDLVDKGPSSLGVLRHAKMLCDLYPGSVVVSGNHEEKALRFARKGKWVEPWAEEAEEKDWAFIEQMPLLWAEGLPTRGANGVRPFVAFAVHGGVFPSFFAKHPDGFARIAARGGVAGLSVPSPAWHKGGGKVMDRARRFLRIRYVSAEGGEMLSLGANKPGDPYWSEVYGGGEGFAVYGHNPTAEPRRDEHAIGIDTGCVFGGRLSAFVVDDAHPLPEGMLVSVPALRKYAEPLEEAED